MEDAGRLAPFKDDKLKYAEIMPFQTGSNYFLSARHEGVAIFDYALLSRRNGEFL